MDEFILTNFLLLTVIMFTCWVILIAVFFEGTGVHDKSRLPINTLKVIVVFLTYSIMFKTYNIQGVNIEMRNFDVLNNRMILLIKHPQDKYFILETSSSYYKKALIEKSLIKPQGSL